jgi:hypothetical protein
MMPKLSLFLIAILCSLISCAQTLTTDCFQTLVKGYLIRKVKSDEIKQTRLNKKLKQGGKPFEQAIDYYERIFFIPFDSLNEVRHLSDILLKGVNYNNKQAFIFDSNKNELFIEKFCGKELAIKKEETQFTEPYYFIEGDQQCTYIYNIQYIEGKAIKAEVENTHTNKIYLGLNYRIDRELKFFDCFFVYTIALNDLRLPEYENIKRWE